MAVKVNNSTGTKKAEKPRKGRKFLHKIFRKKRKNVTKELQTGSLTSLLLEEGLVPTPSASRRESLTGFDVAGTPKSRLSALDVDPEFTLDPIPLPEGKDTPILPEECSQQEKLEDKESAGHVNISLVRTDSLLDDSPASAPQLDLGQETDDHSNLNKEKVENGRNKNKTRLGLLKKKFGKKKRRKVDSEVDDIEMANNVNKVPDLTYDSGRSIEVLPGDLDEDLVNNWDADLASYDDTSRITENCPCRTATDKKGKAAKESQRKRKAKAIGPKNFVYSQLSDSTNSLLEQPLCQDCGRPLQEQPEEEHIENYDVIETRTKKKPRRRIHLLGKLRRNKHETAETPLERNEPITVEKESTPEDADFDAITPLDDPESPPSKKYKKKNIVKKAGKVMWKACKVSWKVLKQGLIVYAQQSPIPTSNSGLTKMAGMKRFE